MAPRARKRIHALRRAPDGSAFQRCECCGVLVALALSDMHDCPRYVGQKRRRGGTERLGIDGQPRERFMKTCKNKNFLEAEQMGFHVWEKMSLKERQPYIIQAHNVNSAYQKIMLEESYDIEEVDDEADSAMVGKFDPEFEGSRSYDVSWDQALCTKFESFDCYDWDILDSWLSDEFPWRLK